MKKIILKIAGISLITLLALYSCQKEEVNQKLNENVYQNDKSLNSMEDNEMKASGGSMFVTHWNGKDCVLPAKDCLPEIVVTPDMNRIIEVVDENQDDYDYRKISSLVENYESIFQDLFGNQVTHDLKNADCMIETKKATKKATKQTPLKSFLIVSDLRGETISVRPLIN